MENQITFASLLLLLLLIPTESTASAPSLTESTVYDLLQTYNFPIGLLPKGITDYDLDPATGKFTVRLNSTCGFALQGTSYSLRYRTTVTGKISRNRISDLTGVNVKVLFFWLNVVEVERDGDYLDLSVGIASAEFGVENFAECPTCGCGFDCVGRGVVDDRLRRGSFLM
ncbi:hypothetical protein QJS04_geneDACA007220 [Acorus gramineus]|uniref:Uncharacterized protein n=1 Tax=Acorus gramineus TaxID=55184 RepID=A0AAV9BT26_ACOGR|nr:hypothetical protein QJS04_geneDACA007220 [Acorus gramineus]